MDTLDTALTVMAVGVTGLYIHLSWYHRPLHVLGIHQPAMVVGATMMSMYSITGLMFLWKGNTFGAVICLGLSLLAMWRAVHWRRALARQRLADIERFERSLDPPNGCPPNE